MRVSQNRLSDVIIGKGSQSYKFTNPSISRPVISANMASSDLSNPSVNMPSPEGIEIIDLTMDSEDEVPSDAGKDAARQSQDTSSDDSLIEETASCPHPSDDDRRTLLPICSMPGCNKAITAEGLIHRKCACVIPFFVILLLSRY